MIQKQPVGENNPTNRDKVQTVSEQSALSSVERRKSHVGRVPPHGVPNVGRVPPHGVPDVGRVPSPGVPDPNDPPPRRLRRLHRVWPDRDGNISYLLTICVDGRARILANEETFQRLVAFLLNSPERYRWFGRRFVVMPDHIHIIARMGYEAIRLGNWIKAMKAVIAGLKPREGAPPDGVGRVPPPGVPCDVGRVPPPGVPCDVGRVPPRGVPPPTPDAPKFTRIPRCWRWQEGFHDHKLRTPESESRKWEYVCLNPVRYNLVQRPEEWPYGGEIFYDDAAGPRLVRGTPPLLETGMLIEEDGTAREATRLAKPPTPGGGTRPTT